ncbi:unnamed protein product [Owenia fusiformis]|uniref:sphingomyelin phosphodiesterase n=1 Tax=Owenia fusiformis TaxID=6347 RepID=A0A8J1V032_OWEFU|nr:unnamed protein product [Owenia fusiformis]
MSSTWLALLCLGALFLLIIPSYGQGPGDECEYEWDICVNNSECNPYAGICVADVPVATRPFVWIGDDPVCDRQTTDCQTYFDLDYDVSHPQGEFSTGWCASGTKHRCLSKVPPPLGAPSPANQLQVVTYNVAERDHSVSMDGQRERTCRIPRKLVELFPEADVFVFQEAFMGGCWDSLEGLDFRDLLFHNGFQHITETVDFEIDDPTIENGGIFVASRWPIMAIEQHIFENYVDIEADSLAAKGIGYAQIEKTVNDVSRIYNIFGTHMQAWDDTEEYDTVREQQAQEMFDFAAGLGISASEPVIFSGDFNADRNVKPGHMANIAAILQSTQPATVGALNVTYDPQTNDFVNAAYPNNPRSWLDYVIYSNNHLVPSQSSMQAVAITSDQPVTMCWCFNCPSLIGDYVFPNDPDCAETKQLTHLSDHHAVLGQFTFP